MFPPPATKIDELTDKHFPLTVILFHDDTDQYINRRRRGEGYRRGHNEIINCWAPAEVSVKFCESSSEGAAAEEARLVSGILTGRKSESWCTRRRPRVMALAASPCSMKRAL